KYLGQPNGRWLGVPPSIGSQSKGPCSRIARGEKYAKRDVEGRCAGGGPPQWPTWTMHTFLKAAESCHKAGFPFGIGLGETTDSVDTAGAIFSSFGAELGDARGDLTVK